MNYGPYCPIELAPPRTRHALPAYFPAPSSVQGEVSFTDAGASGLYSGNETVPTPLGTVIVSSNESEGGNFRHCAQRSLVPSREGMTSS